MPAAAAGGMTNTLRNSLDTVSNNQRRISDDGRYTVFVSSAGNVIAGQVDTNGANDVFVFDRQTGNTELVSHVNDNSLLAANGDSYCPSISADGRYVVYASYASDLAGGITRPPNTAANTFWYDRMTGACSLVSHAYNNFSGGCNGGVNSPMVSADGQTVVFLADATNLIPGFTFTYYFNHLYVWNTSTGNNTLVDFKYGNPTVSGNSAAGQCDLSADGRYVVFRSGSKDLTAQYGGLNGQTYLYDRVSGLNTIVSTNATTGQGSKYGGYYPRISADGKWITLVCGSDDILTGYTEYSGDILIYDVINQVNGLVTKAWNSTSLVGGNANSTNPVISTDGRYITFESEATDLIDSFIDGNAGQIQGRDLYTYDRMTAVTTLITRQAGSTSTSANSGWSNIRGMSGDGKYVLFYSRATDLVPGYQAVNAPDFGSMYLYDRVNDKVTVLNSHFGSVALSGNGESAFGDISLDGNTIAFTTASSDIVPGLLDANASDDVYVRDVATGSTVLASRRLGTPSATAGNDSEWARSSADGRYVVFESMATNLVPGQVDRENTKDIFLRDQQTNSTILVSRAAGTTNQTANGSSATPLISADGRYVAYVSFATDLVSGFVDNNGPEPPDSYMGSYYCTDIFLFDRVTGQTQLVSHQAGTNNAGGDYVSGSFTPFNEYMFDISGDGRYVTYYSMATDLVAGFVDHNGATLSNLTGSDIFVFDRVTGTNRLVTHTPGSDLDGSNDSSYAPKVSGDGRYVTYFSYASTLVTGMANVHARNVFVFDQQTGITTLASHSFSSITTGANSWSTDPAISADGNFVAYASLATNVVSGSDGNGQWDVFLYNRQTNINTLVSHAVSSPVLAGNLVSNFDSFYAKPISDDGRYVTYFSGAQNLVANFVDINGTDSSYLREDVFVYDRLTGSNRLVSRSALAGNAGNSGTLTMNPGISGDGRFIGYSSNANNIISGFLATGGGTANGNLDMYVFDQLTGKNTLVTHATTNDKLEGNGHSYSPFFNYDGSVFVYESLATNLVANDFNSKRDVFAYVTPPPQVASLKINDGTPQRSIVKSITLTFDEPIFFSGNAADAFTVTRQGSVSNVQLQVTNSNSPNGSVTIFFGGPLTDFGSLIDGNYSLSINAAMVSNIASLDGNGDGIAGDNYVGTFHRLFGDADGDRNVAANDFILFRGAFNNPSLIFDLDGDGTVDAADFIQFRLRFGGSI